MTTPKPDLDLRLAVARAVYPEADLWIDTDMQKVMGEHYGEFDSRGHVEPYDLSFDAILPLVRGLTKYSQQQTALHYRLYDWWEINVDTDYDFTEWLIYEATPTDYCLAYLAAMEGK